MSLADAQRRADQALNKVAKWRSVLAGWQLGTREKGDPESDAVRDMRELLILLRVEVSAITNVLLERGVIAHEHFLIALADEAQALDQSYERRFPGASTSEVGVSFDLSRLNEMQEWMRGWKP